MWIHRILMRIQIRIQWIRFFKDGSGSGFGRHHCLLYPFNLFLDWSRCEKNEGGGRNRIRIQPIRYSVKCVWCVHDHSVFSTPSYELMPIMYVCIMYYVAPNWNIWYTKDEYLFFQEKYLNHRENKLLVVNMQKLRKPICYIFKYSTLCKVFEG